MISAETITSYPGLIKSGLIPRKPKQGPELIFLNNYIQTLPSAPKGQVLTVFIEPNVESVFPDAVAVYWDLKTIKKWNINRLKINKTDVRVLHFLALTGSAKHNLLEKYFSCSVVESLEKLEAANLIVKKPRSWQIKPVNEIFAIKRLISIEAKISDWQQGLFQAFSHTWFASESYLLVSKIPQNKKLINNASKFGVGILSEGLTFETSLAPVRKDRIPKSYASWLFNEWTWKATQHSL